MDEILKAMTPWPLLQGVVLGFLVAAAGVWAIRRGLQDSKKNNEPAIEDIKARWEMQKAVAHLSTNSFEIIGLLKRQNELTATLAAAFNRLADTRWNKHQ